jgi:hypothetical protein
MLLSACIGLEGTPNHTTPPTHVASLRCLTVSPQHDDSVLQTTYDDMTSITNGRQSSNGCPVSGASIGGDTCAMHCMVDSCARQAAASATSPHSHPSFMPSAWQAVATMFVTTLNTDCSLVRKLYAAGYEIADHTIALGRSFEWPMFWTI